MSAEKKSAIILAAITLSEGCWVYFNLRPSFSGFMRYTGFASNDAGAVGWILGVIVAIGFIALATRLPSVRQNLFRPSFLKLLALAVAVTAALCEECIFRKWFMDYLQHGGTGVALQVLASGAPEAIRSDRAVIEAYLGPDEDPRERQKDDLLVLGPIE